MLPTSDNRPVDPADQKAGRAMAFSLKCLLDRVAGARDVLPHLAALERGLAAEGPGVLNQVPLPALRKMGAQLASLPVRPKDLPLRALQVQLLQALGRRNASAQATSRPAAPPVDEVEVLEISPSAWAEVSGIFEVDPNQPAT